MRHSLVLAALLSAVAVGQAAAVEVAPGDRNAARDVEDLARSLASTARTAEAAATPGDERQVQRRVASSVEELIVTSGKEPTNVRVALQRVVYVCVRPEEVRLNGFNCPGTDAGMQGLRDVLATVTALIDGSETAATPEGSTPLNSLKAPQMGASSQPDYSQVP